MPSQCETGKCCIFHQRIHMPVGKEDHNGNRSSDAGIWPALQDQVSTNPEDPSQETGHNKGPGSLGGIDLPDVVRQQSQPGVECKQERMNDEPSHDLVSIRYSILRLPRIGTRSRTEKCWPNACSKPCGL